MHINSNTFYRITNVALGTSLSLDVADPKGGTPSGLVDLTSSRLSSAQCWQLLDPTEADRGRKGQHKGHNGPYYLSSSILGPQQKLDVSMVDKTTWVPHFQNLTTAHDQTWILTTHNDTSIGINTTTYSLSPHYQGGPKFLSVKNDTQQPFLDDVGGINQHWMLTPVMQINDAAFSASAFWRMSRQTATATSGSIKSTGLPGSASSHSATGKTAVQFTIPKPVLIAIIAAPLTLVLSLCILTSMFLHVRRCRRKKAAAAAARVEEKLGNPWQDSSSQVWDGSRPPFTMTRTRIYSPSIASSGEFARSMQPDFDPLDPRPPSRPMSWIRGRDNEPFYGASALGNNFRNEQREPQISPMLPAELSAGSRRASVAEIEDMSPRSPFIPSRESEMERETRSPTWGTMRRQTSLISHWKV